MSHIPKPTNILHYASVQLGGIAYAILPASALLAACRKAGIRATPRRGGGGMGGMKGGGAELDMPPPDSLDTTNLAQRIAARRKAAGLTQAQLARRAGVRGETVNRIERGHVTPDFRTIRKLVQAMADAAGRPPFRQPKEKAYVP